MKKKILVKSKKELDFLKSVMTIEKFYSEFELSMELVSSLCANKMLSHIANTDRAFAPEELKTLGV